MRKFIFALPVFQCYIIYSAFGMCVLFPTARSLFYAAVIPGNAFPLYQL